ncbi:MAG: ribosome recycling factor [Bacteriovoracia bacterium]
MGKDMEKSVQSLQKELVKVRTGRASTALVDSVSVDYYGSNVPISQVANVTVPDARTVQIVPWEPAMIAPIEKAILAANIGLNPRSDGKVIRLPVPSPTEERRKEMVKVVKKLGEDAKIAVRNHRRDANEEFKKQEKAKAVSTDEAKKGMDLIQKKTDEKIAEVDKLIEAKEKEIMTV